MSRSVPWQRSSSDAVSWHQDQANNTTIFILRETGPTGFLLKEENEPGKFKVYLGDPNTCTCPTYKKEKQLCKHICWVLLKKFKVPRQNPLSWQLGLVEREINEILRGVTEVGKAGHRAVRLSKQASGQDEGTPDGTLPQRPISAEDVCPICQEELLAKHLPVTYCKYGCGNSVHLKCMKVWAEHQTSTGEKNINCPFCREDFGPLSSIQQELRNTTVGDIRASIKLEHPGTVCCGCDVTPITGKCYKCTACPEIYLCQKCFNSPVHTDHDFNFREKTSQRWRPVQRSNCQLPGAVIQNLMARDITEDDYDLLLQLDSEGAEVSDLTEETVKSLPLEQIRTAHNPLLAPGQQCRVCLQRYSQGQWLRRLPCKHYFHKDCIDNWLLHNQSKCPIDGMSFTNTSIRRWREAIRKAKQQSQAPDRQTTQVQDNSGYISLEIPGFGINKFSPHSAHSQNLYTGLALTSSSRSRSKHRPMSQPTLASELGVCGQRPYGSMIENAILAMQPVLTGESENLAIGIPPTIQSPSVQSPSAQSPSVQSPSAQSPSVQSTSVQSPSAQSPSVQSPSAQSPSVPSPSVKSPSVQSQSRTASASLVRQPVAPSIPPTHQTMEDLLVTAAAAADAKPPKPQNTAGSKMRNRHVHSNIRHRSASRDQIVISSPAEGDRGLYIGNDPGSSVGFLNEYCTRPSSQPSRLPSHNTALASFSNITSQSDFAKRHSTIAMNAGCKQKPNDTSINLGYPSNRRNEPNDTSVNLRRNDKVSVKPKKKAPRDTTSGGQHWGSMRQLSGSDNDIVLSGSSLNSHL